MILQFDRPIMLYLLLLAIPIVLIGWRSLGSVEPLRRWTVIGTRVVVVAIFAVLLAAPRMIKTHDHLTVIGLLDVSGSVKRFADLPEIPDLNVRSNLEFLRQWFRIATQTREPDDRFGLVVFDGRAIAISTPTRGDYVDDQLDVRILEGTNIADAIELGLAMFPPDAAKRLVLVSDGNETLGDAIAAAEKAAGESLSSVETFGMGVPIDVAPIAYSVQSDVQVVRVEVPPTAQPEQTVTARIVLESIRPTPGRLMLFHEGVPVDLNGDAPGTSRRIVAPAGRSVHLTPVDLGTSPINRFEARFEAELPGADMLLENNRAEAFTATPSRGRVLFVDGDGLDDSGFLARTIESAGIEVERTNPELMPADLLSMQAYDLIILQNVAAYEVSGPIQELLARYVNDFGGGLIMVGGEKSFGAGGWNGTPVEDVLPVELDLPREIRMPRAAVVLVLDKSGSMASGVAGARATQQEVANQGSALAIKSLQGKSYIGVVTFDSFAHERVPMQVNDDPDAIAERVLSITASGGTNMNPALRMAHEMLKNVDADRKRVVCLTDGQSTRSDQLEGIVLEMLADNIRLTTIAVGDHADDQLLEHLAEVGKGEFWSVRNPKILPRVLVESVQIVNKPLIKEVPFVPIVQPTGSTLTTGMGQAPPLGGLVLTAPRDDQRAILEMTNPDGDPLLAHWQAGLGRVAVFTSDARGHWSEAWLPWSGYSAFWTQLVRATTRPLTNQNYDLAVSIDVDRLDITLDALDEAGEYLDHLRVFGTVYTPSGEAVGVRLNQIGPGRYHASVPASEGGNYIVALTPQHGNDRLPPVIGGASQSAGAEFRRYRSNVALLQQIAEITHGRQLDLSRPEGAELYDRAGMPTTVSSLPAWRTFLWWLLALILLDVACRRIAWDRWSLQRLCMAALARVTPAHVRGARAAATLASLRDRNEEIEREITQAGSSYEKLQGDSRLQSPVRPIPPHLQSSGGPPDRKRVGAILDALTGHGPRPPQPAEPAAEEPDEPDRKPATETTGGLLAAKRRARERMNRDANPDES